MKVNVEVSMEDIARMLKEPEDKHTPLEVALMKKCARLYESLKKKKRGEERTLRRRVQQLREHDEQVR